ncbi:terminase small subunit [Desulfurivibrio alkaliphilus]|uniref:Terminase small subunit n=1 Tax=Desulfurivibrio alkaliphilus (strain DSM 19089 / UNIQEM U267 / AHT2) TaxID=589865 RepID=D6Z661_DESAT|nr:terminase small subunit [Desulfurivibrio alkaliphilus]ADH86826.1 Terminase small subunit [Desulfurivibrio alkaliphilus AHT 2]
MPGKKGVVRSKAGTSRAAAAHRRKLFVEAYIACGGNATEAAIAAGYSVKTATSQGSRLLTEVKVLAMLKERQEEIARRYEVNAETVMKSMAAAIHFDPRKLFDAEGRLKPITALDDDTVLALQSFKLAAPKGTGGEDDIPLHAAEIKWESKATARDQACKILGLYEKDNRQKGQGGDSIYRMSMEELEKIARGEA